MIKSDTAIAEQVANIIQRSGRRDAFFANLFAVNQSTVSRLRAGKIKKASKYIDILIENRLVDTPKDSASMSAIADLIDAANSHPELAEALAGLQKFVHKIMQK